MAHTLVNYLISVDFKGVSDWTCMYNYAIFFAIRGTNHDREIGGFCPRDCETGNCLLRKIAIALIFCGF